MFSVPLGNESNKIYQENKPKIKVKKVLFNIYIIKCMFMYINKYISKYTHTCIKHIFGYLRYFCTVISFVITVMRFVCIAMSIGLHFILIKHFGVKT